MGMVVTMVQFSASKLDEFIANPSTFINELPSLVENPADPSAYLDKSWDAIQYVLTGKQIGKISTLIDKVIYSEQFFDEEQELGLGPASYLTPEQVKEINTLLQPIDGTILKERYNPEQMDKIGVYPVIWGKNPDLFTYLQENFLALKGFYQQAASKGNAVASWLS